MAVPVPAETPLAVELGRGESVRPEGREDISLSPRVAGQHIALTPDERARVFWDFSWVWGPPEDELAHLFRTIGAERFVYGTGWPLRLTQGPRANLALLPDELRWSALTDLASW